MAKNEVVPVKISIWKCGGPNHEGYCLAMEFLEGNTIELCFAKYKKDIIPKLRESRKMLKSIPTDKQFKILHIIWDEAKLTL
ncbi:unnamed protein product [marine sediment metagenome]|uniref:Uncharacterized protein n=1 Tax=marine sediment metagenome TaxID=412755 RepID=X0TXZ7_9ZZZZ